MHKITKSLVSIVLLIIIPVCAFADITGKWTGSTIANGGVYPNEYTFTQNGSSVTGSTVLSNNGSVCSATGQITGLQFTLHSDCPSINYSSDSIATLNAANDFMSGTFLDSQGTQGTFTLSKVTNVLTPQTQITEAPAFQVTGKNVSFTFLEFDNIQQAAARRLAAAKAPKPPVLKYELTIKGAEKRKIVSKKNVLTVKNLKPGNYTATYRALAVQKDKNVIATNKSPTASFTIVK